MLREMQTMTKLIRLRKNKSSLEELSLEMALPFEKKCPAESAVFGGGVGLGEVEGKSFVVFKIQSSNSLAKEKRIVLHVK